MIIVAIQIVATTEEVSLRQALLSAARCSLDDLGPLELRDFTIEHTPLTYSQAEDTTLLDFMGSS